MGTEASENASPDGVEKPRPFCVLDDNEGKLEDAPWKCVGTSFPKGYYNVNRGGENVTHVEKSSTASSVVFQKREPRLNLQEPSFPSEYKRRLGGTCVFGGRGVRKKHIVPSVLPQLPPRKRLINEDAAGEFTPLDAGGGQLLDQTPPNSVRVKDDQASSLYKAGQIQPNRTSHRSSQRPGGQQRFSEARPSCGSEFIDPQTAEKLGHLSTSYKYDVPVLRRDIVGPGKQMPAKVKRYFKRRLQGESQCPPPPGSKDTVPLSAIAEATRACEENSSSVTAWLHASRLESSDHIAGLSQKDRLNRRISILRDGLSRCSSSTELLLELMSVAELRDSPELVDEYYQCLLNKAFGDEPSSCSASLRHPHFDAPPDGDDGDSVLSIVSSTERLVPDPQLIVTYLHFLLRSLSQFSCGRYLQQALLFYNKFAASSSKARPRKRFDQTREQLEAEQLREPEHAENPSVLHLGGLVLKTLMSASQWPIVAAAVQAVAHLDFRLESYGRCCTVPGGTGGFNRASAIAEALAFWGSDAPRLGHSFATALYVCLGRTEAANQKVAQLPEQDISSGKASYYTVVNGIIDGVVDAFSSTCSEPTKCTTPTKGASQMTTALRWFDSEVQGDQLRWHLHPQRGNGKAPDTLHDAREQEALQPAFPAHLAFFLETFASDSNAIVRHCLLDVLGYPFSLARFPSNHSTTCSSVTSSAEVDVLLAVMAGLQRRISRGGISPPGSTGEEGGDGAASSEKLTLPSMASPDPAAGEDGPLLLNEIFGYPVGGTVTPDIAFFQTIARRLQQALSQLCGSSCGDWRDSGKMEVEVQQLHQFLREVDAVIRSQGVSRAMVHAHTCTIFAAQMLAWAPNDILLLTAVVGSLSYAQHTELARSLLELHDREPSVWASFILFDFASCPTPRRLQKARRLLVRSASALGCFPSDLSFLAGWLRVEFLGLRQLQTLASRGPRRAPPGRSYAVAPSIQQILCGGATGSFEAWERAVCLADPPSSRVDDGHKAGDPGCGCTCWGREIAASRVSMAVARRFYESRIAQLSQETETLHSAPLPVMIPSFFVAVLGAVLLTAELETPDAAWKRLLSFLPAPQGGGVAKVPYQHEIEVVLDLILLTILTASPTSGVVSTVWTTRLVDQIVAYTLSYFPHQTRAVAVAAQVHCSRSTLVTLRSSLRSASVSLKALVTSELLTGFPCYRRIEDAFECALERPRLKCNPQTWELYVLVLYLVELFGSSLFTGLPYDDWVALRPWIRQKLSAVCQRARFHCPFSKRAWLYMFYTLRSMPAWDAVAEDRFLEELQLLYQTNVVCQLDPLVLLTL